MAKCKHAHVTTFDGFYVCNDCGATLKEKPAAKAAPEKPEAPAEQDAPKGGEE